MLPRIIGECVADVQHFLLRRISVATHKTMTL